MVNDRVRALEAHLETRLLHRTTRSQTLTEGGASYLERATRIVEDITVRTAGAWWHARRAAAGSLGRCPIAPLVARFSQEHPQIRIHLTLDDRFGDITGEGFDIAVRGGPTIDSQFVGRHLIDTRRVVVASPAYLERVGTPATSAELRNHRCLVFNKEVHFHAEWSFGGGDALAERVEGALVSSNSELPISWALADAGLTQKSWWEVAPHIATGRLRTVLDAFEPDPVSFYAVHPLRSAQRARWRCLSRC